MNGGRVWAIAHNVFRETIRDKILYLILLYAAIMAGAVLLIPQISNGAEVTIVLNLGLAGIEVLGLIVAVFVGTNLVNKEIEKRTVYVLVAKPISRAELIVGKHLGLTALLSLLLTVMMGIDFGLSALLQPNLPFASLAIAVAFIFLELSLVVGAAILFGTITSSILATLLTFALYLMGHLSRVLLQFGASMDSELLKRGIQGLFLVLPDLSRLNLKNDAVYAQLPGASELGLSALYGALYTVVLLSIATMVFSRRQV